MNTLQSPLGHTGPFGNTLKRKNAIQVHRDRPVEDILYQDAIRRQHSIESKQREAVSKTREIANGSGLVSRESQKIVMQRFERELNLGVQELVQAQRDLKISDLLLDH
jgi:phosphoketolase